jgi:hypothetical protein
MATETKSWRDVLPVHPAANLFPLMSNEELKDISDDIKKNGLQEQVVLTKQGELLEGRNRLDAMELAGIALFEEPGTLMPKLWRPFLGDDPVAFVISANLHRRHLTVEQKHELIEKLLKVAPEKSDRQIADEATSNRTTVGQIRKKLETSGDVSIVDTRIDRKGRKQQAHKTPKVRPQMRRPAIEKQRVNPIVQLRKQLDAAVAAAVSVSPMQPIIDTMFDRAADLAERNGNVKLFMQRVRQRIDAMERQIGQAQEKPTMPVSPPTADAAEGIPEPLKRQAQV